MRIAMILDNGFDPDPRVYKEAKYLISKGVQVTVFCWDRDINSSRKAEDVIDGISVVRFRIHSVYGSGYHQIPAYIKFARQCKISVKNAGFDYIHCHDLTDAIIGWRISSMDLPYVFDMHELYEDVGIGRHHIKRHFVRNLTKALIRDSKYALYENDIYTLRKYKGIWAKLLPLKNYPDTNLVRYMPKTLSDIFRISYCGGLRRQIREFTALFEAVKGMDDVRVDIHGDGVDYEELKVIQEQYKNVYIHGPFDGTKELTCLYQNTDVTFAGYRPTSDTREYAEVVKFFESIVTGTPIILTHGYTSMERRVIDQGFGLTCDTRDPAAIREAILKLKNDKDFWRQCSENELAEAHKYDWNEAVKVLDKVYDL